MKTDEIFFRDVLSEIEIKGISKLIVVSHLNRQIDPFFDALSQKIQIAGIIPKSSVRHFDHFQKFKYYKHIVRVSKKEIINNPDNFLGIIKSSVGKDSFAIIDVGGYFSYVYQNLSDHFKNQLIGIVEDTENGHQKYEIAIKKTEIKKYIPVVSVARSLLKDPEDSLVGEAIVFSAEAILRNQGKILTGKNALVIGYGKIGSGISRALQKRSVRVDVHDTDPVRLAIALSQGMHTELREQAISKADLIFCATGNKSLSIKDLEYFKNNSYIFCATSSDDEINDCLRQYFINHLDEEITSPIFHKGKVIYVCNNGDPVNFLHGGVVGGFIRLIQAEMMLGLSYLGKVDKTIIHQIPVSEKKFIAQHWITNFSKFT